MSNLGVTIQIDGLDKVIAKFKGMPDLVGKHLERAIYKVALILEGKSKILSPVDTGRLRASIQTTIYPMKATIGPNVNYAIYVHEGTRYMAPRPFLGDAVTQEKGNIEQVFNDEIKKAL